MPRRPGRQDLLVRFRWRLCRKSTGAIVSPLSRRGAETLDAVADRGYYDSQQILACEHAGIAVTLPKPLTSGAKAAGRFGKRDFVYVAAEDIYRCPAGERLTYRFTVEEDGKVLRRY